MKVGFVGLGNLGLPCALAIEHYGNHEVFGFDCRESAYEPLRTGKFSRIEPGVEDLLRTSNIRISSIEEIVRQCDIVFVAVQTPHDPRFEGTTFLTEERVDFDYTYLRSAMLEIAEAAEKRSSPIIVNVVSTVLPGTMAREIEPLLGTQTKLSYNPFFIAMGTTIRDFMNPEFVLLGSRDPEVGQTMERFYRTLHDRPCTRVTVESAELIKVSYNTFIGLKIAFVNCLMEVSEKTGADVDEVTGALCQAADRLISPKYMQAGMGDGGGCHPRDNIAMSYLARKLGLSFDLFESAILAREGHTRWLADILENLTQANDLPVIVMGKAYKADSDLATGSPSLLLLAELHSRMIPAVIYDPLTDADALEPAAPAIYFMATNHSVFANWPFPTGSIVVDPWGTQSGRSGISLRQPGRARLTVFSSVGHAQDVTPALAT